MNSAIETLPIAAPPKTVVRPQLAYLLSHYPAFSHTFFLNEIQGLRREGFDIVTASINPCDQPAAEMEEAARDALAHTFYVKSAGAMGVLRALLSTVFRHPLGLLRGLYYTLQLGGGPIRFFYFLEALLVGEWMRREQRTHLHTHFGGAVASVAVITAHTFPITMSLTLHGPDEFWDVSKFYLRKKIETASFVICISSYGRSQLMMLTPSSMWDKLVVARLGVDPAKFSPHGRVPSTDPLEIVCVGRLVGAKGQHVLLAAFRHLIEEGRNVRLRLVGNGPQRATLEAATAEYGLQDRVIFEGAVGVDRVRKILERASIFALPSFAEGIPVALMEAMAMEIPCVSTTIAGIPELIRSGVDGLLVAPADENQLAEALARLIDDPELRRRMGASARVRVENDYNLERSVKVLGEVFQCRL